MLQEVAFHTNLSPMSDVGRFHCVESAYTAQRIPSRIPTTFLRFDECSRDLNRYVESRRSLDGRAALSVVLILLPLLLGFDLRPLGHRWP